MICKCTKCEKQFDSKNEGYNLPAHNGCQCCGPNQVCEYQKGKTYCEDCFIETFQCDECGGFKNKFAMAVYDGNLCECD